MIADPTGILSRVPELEALTEDPGVRRAIERGDLHRLYRILFWANLFGRMRAHRETIRLLLARRRLFLTPLRGAPGLYTVNGVGLSAYGNEDADPNDGTFILTHYVVFFFIPLFPLRQYLVRRADGGGRGWTFFGKVPFGGLTFFWNRLVAMAVAAGVAFGVFSAWHSSRYHEVHLVNGTGLPVNVAIGDQRAELGPEDHKAVTVKVGRQHVEVKGPSGSVIETTDLDVAAGASVLAVNVLGAAPLYFAEVRYGPQGAPHDDTFEPRMDLACGKTLIRYDSIDYVFVEPPRTISLPQNSSGASRSRVDVFPGGLQSCLNYLANKDQLGPAAALAKRVAEATGFAVPLANNMAVAMLGQSEGLAASLAFAEQARAANPKDLETQRLFQHLGTATGKRDQLVTLYRKQLDEAPNDPDRAYLMARLLSPAASQPIFAGLVQRFPQHLWIRRAHAYSEFQLRHFDAALQSYQQLRKLSADDWAEVLPMVARVMVASGQGREALREIEASFAADRPGAMTTAELYADVARAVGENAELLFGRLDQNGPKPVLAWRRTIAGLPVDDAVSRGLPSDLRESIAIVRAAGSDPGEALALVARASVPALRTLDEETWVLAYAEAVRRGDEAAMRALAPAGSIKDELAQAVRDFIASGRMGVALEEGPFEWRAAVEFVRSRVTKVAAAERSRLVAAARKDDLLHGRVTTAIDGWKQR